MTVFKLPDLGEGLSEAEILHWHVKVGDHIAADAPMLAVETAKAVVEVPSPVSGTILALHAQPGARIEIGAPLIEFALDEPSPDTNEDAGTVVGHMPPPLDFDALSARTAPAAATAGPGRVRAVPAARALARSLGVEIDTLSGSGRDGLVTLDDVLARGVLPLKPPLSPPLSPPLAPPPAPASLQGAVEPLRSLRRTMAQSMALARDSVMPCTVFDDADLHRWHGAGDYTVRVLRAVANAVRAEPALNAWYDPPSQTRTLFKHVDVGLAIDTADGLLVAVLRQVEQLDAPQLRAELNRLKHAARERSLRTDELQHFTFMLSNFGTMAGRYATPVVVPPAVAILGTGRARPDVLAVASGVEVHSRMPLSLTFDHRVVTGGEAVRFLAALIDDLEQSE